MYILQVGQKVRLGGLRVELEDLEVLRMLVPTNGKISELAAVGVMRKHKEIQAHSFLSEIFRVSCF